jgi:hypothetical protein
MVSYTLIMMILAWVAGLMVGIGVGAYWVLHAEGFNYTDYDKETRLLNACIFYELEAEACQLIYGGIPK